jgi:VWFA-related protein
MKILLSSLLLLTVGAAAQQVGQNKNADGSSTFTLSVKAQLVVEAVVVKDKQGKPVQGLTAKDFTITEDGVEQKIRFVEHQNLSNAEVLPIPSAENEDVTIYKRLSRTQIAGESPDKMLHNDRRLMALYFDMTALPPSDQLRALTAAEKFIRTQMTTVDLVSILRYQGGSVDVLQDFTADRNKLLSILQTLVVGEGQGMEESADDASSADTGAAFGQDDAEFNVFNTDRQLSALQTAARMLGQLNEKKQLIYFASGLNLNGVDNQAQLHATVDAAIKAGVQFWPIDARGLTASAPLGDATQGSPGNQGMYTGAAQGAVVSRFQKSQDTLYALAGDTGGKALFDNNDLTKGITDAQKAVSDYYIVGYYTSNTAQNGRFRKVKVSLTNGVVADLSYRLGYYADKVFAKFTAVDKERQLEDALMLDDPVTDLTIAMEIDYFQLNHAEYFLPIIVKIPGKELALAKKGGAEHTTIDFVGEIKDLIGGTTVQNVRDHVDMKLSDKTAAQLASGPIEYDTGYTLLPGKYMIKILARDDETGRIGTYQTNFVIPNLNKELKHVAISSVVLSGQRTNLKDAIYDAAKTKDQAKAVAVDPLVVNGARLVPSVTRVFSKARDLYVYLQAYQQGVTTPTPLVAFVSFYQGQSKVFETQPIAVTPAAPTSPRDSKAPSGAAKDSASAAASKLVVVPMSFNINLKDLPPGNYDCQVNIVDPTGAKGTFWQAPIVVVP